jgi:hypothetical protein
LRCVEVDFAQLGDLSGREGIGRPRQYLIGRLRERPSREVGGHVRHRHFVRRERLKPRKDDSSPAMLEHRRRGRVTKLSIGARESVRQGAGLGQRVPGGRHVVAELSLNAAILEPSVDCLGADAHVIGRGIHRGELIQRLSVGHCAAPERPQ